MIYNFEVLLLVLIQLQLLLSIVTPLLVIVVLALLYVVLVCHKSVRVLALINVLIFFVKLGHLRAFLSMNELLDALLQIFKLPNVDVSAIFYINKIQLRLSVENVSHVLTVC